MSSTSKRFSVLTPLAWALSLHIGLACAQATEPTESTNPDVAAENAVPAAAAEEPAADATDPPPPGSTEELPPYSAEGADTCLKCHDEDATVPVLAIFKTKHAVQADERTPFAQLQCARLK